MEPLAPVDGTALVSGRPVRFELRGEDKKIADRNRTAGKISAIFFAVFFALGTVFVVFLPGGLGIWNYAVWLPIGSTLFWVWLGMSLVRPWTDLTVSAEGFVAHDTKGKEFRYHWRDPKLRILLSHTLETPNSSFRTPMTDWGITARPPSSSGLVPDNCYAYLLESARSAGLSTHDRTYHVSSKGGGWWMAETAVGPPTSP